jgi:hypothetical protein
MPGVHQPQKAAIHRNAAARVVGKPAEEQTRYDAQWHVLHRQQREHRHEHELRRRRRPGTDFEVDSGGERVTGYEHEERPEARLPGRVGKRRKRDCNCKK